MFYNFRKDKRILVPSTASHPSAQKAGKNQKLAATVGHASLKLKAVVEIKITSNTDKTH